MARLGASLIAELSVIVMEFGSEAQAKAAYERELKSQGSRHRKPPRFRPTPP